MTDIRNETESAIALLNTAADLTAEGRLVSIRSLKERVAAICSAVKAADSAERTAMKPLITELAEKIDAFGRLTADLFLALKKEFPDNGA